MRKIICTVCKQEKELSEFYEHKGMTSGHLNQCKECIKARTKEREVRMSKEPYWMERERKRAKEKYYKLKRKNK